MKQTRKTTPVHIGRHYQNILKTLNLKTRIPQRYLVETALDRFLQKDHPEHFKHLQKLLDKEDGGVSQKIERAS